MFAFYEKKLITLFFSTVMLMLSSPAQEVKVYANNEKLSDVLINLNENYNVNLSFNHKILSECIVSDSSTYSSSFDAIKSLCTICGLSFEKSGGVFIIYKAETAGKEELSAKDYHFSLQLTDSYSGEGLPYAKIIIGSVDYTSDNNGNFSFRSPLPKINIIVSHTGYYIQSFTVENNNFTKLQLTPSVVGLKEVILTGELFSKVANNRIGDKAGLLKLNHKAAKFLPGNNNNTLYNLLRLQPGVLASSEQSGDYTVWGSYRGQTLLKFDGITLFSSTSINNDIGLINPLIVKDIEVFKGGYPADKGDRAGAIIDISGTSGNSEKIAASVNVNSKTISAILSLPLASKYAVQMALRQSYYGIVDWDDILGINSKDGESYSPEYDFSDFNLKFSGKLDSGDNFYVSSLASKDNSRFNYESGTQQQRRLLSNEKNISQKGASAHYNKNWKSFGRTEFDVSYSDYRRNREIEYREPQGSGGQSFSNLVDENFIDEISFGVKHGLPASGYQKMSFGLTYFENKATIFEGETEADSEVYSAASSRLNMFINDDVFLGKYLVLSPGIRVDYFSNSNKLHYQPRLQATVAPADKWKFNLAWGYYNQYVSSIVLIDELNNKINNWILSDDSDYPVVKGEHYVLGLSYKQPGLSVSVETYLKNIDDMVRYRKLRGSNSYELLYGEGRLYGVDFYVEKKISKHNFWMSYSYSRAEEKFGEQSSYQRAFQDQTHELKAATILDFHPWYFSANYVYGSGLYGIGDQLDSADIPYNRMDVAFVYRFNAQFLNLETGLSVENLFNYKNVAYTSISRLPGGELIYARAIPFTPSIFVNIAF